MRYKTLLRLIDNRELVSVDERKQRDALKVFYKR